MKFIYSLILSLVLTSVASASEFKPAGTVLEEDSMVFTVQEAQNLRLEILRLEEKIKQLENIDKTKDVLLENKDKQIVSFEEYLENKDSQISKYLEIKQIDEKRITQLNRQARGRKLENAGFFVGGIATSILLIIAADRLDDNILENQ